MRLRQKSNAPEEEWRIEIRERHAAEVCVGPTERVRENRLKIDLRNAVMPGSVPCAWHARSPYFEQQIAAKNDGKEGDIKHSSDGAEKSRVCGE